MAKLSGRILRQKDLTGLRKGQKKQGGKLKGSDFLPAVFIDSVKKNWIRQAVTFQKYLVCIVQPFSNCSFRLLPGMVHEIPPENTSLKPEVKT